MSTLTVSPVVLAKMKMRAKFPPATTNRIAARTQTGLAQASSNIVTLRVATMATTMRPACSWRKSCWIRELLSVNYFSQWSGRLGATHLKFDNFSIYTTWRYVQIRSKFWRLWITSCDYSGVCNFRFRWDCYFLPSGWVATLLINAYIGYDKEYHGGLSHQKFTSYNLVKLPPLFNSPATISYSSLCFLLFLNRIFFTLS